MQVRTRAVRRPEPAEALVLAALGGGDEKAFAREEAGGDVVEGTPHGTAQPAVRFDDPVIGRDERAAGQGRRGAADEVRIAVVRVHDADAGPAEMAGEAQGRARVGEAPQLQVEHRDAQPAELVDGPLPIAAAEVRDMDWAAAGAERDGEGDDEASRPAQLQGVNEEEHRRQTASRSAQTSPCVRYHAYVRRAPSARPMRGTHPSSSRARAAEQHQ